MNRCSHHRITISARDKAHCLRELHDLLLNVGGSHYTEIWVDHGDFPAICSLINGDRGWLMYLRYDGDAGFSTRNPEYAGPVESTVDYLLGNGQRDEYPASWTMPIHRIFEALEWFAANKTSPTEISWFNDSGDGNVSPNDEFVILD